MAVLPNLSSSRDKESIKAKAADEKDIVVSVKNVSKKFCRHLKRSMAYGIVDLTKNMVGIKPDSTTLRKDEFWALNNINFELKKGDSLGIIGLNGSGKTTLLRLITGVFPPDKGEIMVKGRVGALVAVGAGFHPHMTGRENIYLNGTILGMSREEINDKFQEIVDFSEIGEFLGAPVSVYSSGMRVRLGFAIAINIKPDILLIDEVLSVGDLSFQNKSLRRLAELRQRTNAIIFVSHNLEHIRTLCHQVLILNKGVPAFYGDTAEALSKYHELSRELILQSEERKKEGFKDVGHISSGDIEFLGGGVLGSDGKKTKKIQQGEDIKLYFDFVAKIKILKPYASIGILGEKGEVCIWHVSREHCNLSDIAPGKYRLELLFNKPKLVPGVYNTNFALRSAFTGETYERYGKDDLRFIVNGKQIPRGIVACDSKWELKEIGQILS